MHRLSVLAYVLLTLNALVQARLRAFEHSWNNPLIVLGFSLCRVGEVHESKLPAVQLVVLVVVIRQNGSAKQAGTCWNKFEVVPKPVNELSEAHIGFPGRVPSMPMVCQRPFLSRCVDTLCGTGAAATRPRCNRHEPESPGPRRRQIG